MLLTQPFGRMYIVLEIKFFNFFTLIILFVVFNNCITQYQLSFKYIIKYFLSVIPLKFFVVIKVFT